MGGQASKTEPILVTNNLQKDSTIEKGSESVSMIIATTALILITVALVSVCLYAMCRIAKKKLIDSLSNQVNIQGDHIPSWNVQHL